MDSSHYNKGNRLFFFKITAQGLLKRGNANVEKPSRAGAANVNTRLRSE
jgi:hypothetical protein